jgi:hypothetical protein
MRITSTAHLRQSPPKLPSKITANALGGGKLSIVAASPSRALHKTLANISTRRGAYKPCALVVHGERKTLRDRGDTSLPLALGGLTRLFTLAMVLRDIDRGALSLDTAIVDMLPDDLVSGLCVTIQPSSSGRPHLMGLASHSGAGAGINPDTLTIGFVATNQLGDPHQGFSDLSTIVHKSSR